MHFTVFLYSTKFYVFHLKNAFSKNLFMVENKLIIGF